MPVLTQIGTSGIKDNAITTAKIGADAVTTAKIGADAVTTAKIGAGAVGTTEIADNAVLTGKIQDGTLTTADLANNAVTVGKLATSGTLPALDGSALTGIDNPIDNHIRVTFSGPTVSNGAVTILTPTLQGETNGGFTIQNTNQIKISVTGHYLVTFIASASVAGGAGYTPISYIYKNASSWNARAGIRAYSGSSTIDFPSNTTIVSMDSTSDYFKFAVYQNSGNNATSPYGTASIVRLGD